MPALDWSHCSAVESVPGTVSGAWVLKGTRVPGVRHLRDLTSVPVSGGSPH